MFRYFSIVLALFATVSISACKKKDTPPNINVPPSDSFQVSVEGGYGSGLYKAGDTVHVFSVPPNTNQLFGQWTGDIGLLNSAQEWHTWFIMPAKNVSLNGSIKSIPAFTLVYTQIMGRDRLKPVYYYFPPATKGIVYLLHGTGGSAAVIAADFEWQQVIKDLVTDGFAVVVTEAEEATTKVDANSDGKLRWALLPVDTDANVDFANIAAITDTLVQRGIAQAGTPRYSLGMSDGGFFSAALAYLYHYIASVQYCAQGSTNLMQVTSIPTQFCMAENDNNDEVGQAGNAAAFSNSASLQGRRVCSRFLSQPRCPIYPRRFARSGLMSTALSESIYQELQTHGFLDGRGYYNGFSDSLTSVIQNNPSSLPVINSLTPGQKIFMIQQINQCVSDHHMYSDFDRATLDFLNNPCR